MSQLSWWLLSMLHNTAATQDVSFNNFLKKKQSGQVNVIPSQTLSSNKLQKCRATGKNKTILRRGSFIADTCLVEHS